MKTTVCTFALLTLLLPFGAQAGERSQGRSTPQAPAVAAETTTPTDPAPSTAPTTDAAASEQPAADDPGIARMPPATPSPSASTGSWGTKPVTGAAQTNDQPAEPAADEASTALTPPGDPVPMPTPTPTAPEPAKAPPASTQIAPMAAAGPAELVKPLEQPQSRSYDLYALTSWNRTGVTLNLNGIDVLQFGYGLPERGIHGDYLTPWLVKGENVFKVTFNPADTGIVAVEKSASLILRAAPQGQNLKTFDHDETITLRQDEVPTWSWQAGEAWNGDYSEVLAAVQDLYNALNEHDMSRVNAIHQARYDDFAKIYGAPNAADFAAASERLRQSTPLPLDQMLVRRHADGRLIHVTDRSGKAPIMVRFADGGTQRTGEWWSKINGTWQVVR